MRPKIPRAGTGSLDGSREQTDVGFQPQQFVFANGQSARFQKLFDRRFEFGEVPLPEPQFIRQFLGANRLDAGLREERNNLTGNVLHDGLKKEVGLVTQ